MTEVDSFRHVLGNATATAGNPVFAKENVESADGQWLLRDPSNHQKTVDATRPVSLEYDEFDRFCLTAVSLGHFRMLHWKR